MAVQIIAFPVVARQNTNDDSTAFGKWFLTPYWPETLNLRGLIELRFFIPHNGDCPRCDTHGTYPRESQKVRTAEDIRT